MMFVSTINHNSCVNILTKVMHVTFTPLRLLTAATISCFIGTWSLSAIAAEPMTLKIDITRPTRGLIEAECTIAIDESDEARVVSLWYPKWVPGSHGPGGPIANIAGLEVASGQGSDLIWKRAPGEVYRIDVDVPGGVDRLCLSIRYIMNQPTTTSFGHDCFAGRSIGVVSPSCLLFYQDGMDIDIQQINTTVTMPDGWAAASALRLKKKEPTRPSTSDSNTVDFEAVSLRVLLDSPIMLGPHYQTYELAEASSISPPHTLHVFGDSPDTASLNGEIVQMYKEMVKQTSLLVGSHPFERFDILLGITNQIPKNGLEHSRSTFNVLTPSSLSTVGSLKGWDRLLVPHEYLHAWCGKYRRPEGMVRSDFHTAKDTSLLWVYEGLTQYLGELVEARSGLMSEAEFEARLFVELRNAVHQDGRKWRTLADTGSASHTLRSGSAQWGSLRRSQDYYMEGMLFWLEVDALIRNGTDNNKTLDDFCHEFFRVDEELRTPKPYGRSDVVDCLNSVMQFDWDGLILRRIESKQESFSPVVASLLGYEFGLGATRQKVPGNTFRYRAGADFLDSIGVVFSSDGVITTVKLDGIGDQLGLTKGMKVIGVGGKKWSEKRLAAAIEASKKNAGIPLTISDDENLEEIVIPYKDGSQYYQLVLGSEKESLLPKILEPQKPRR